MSDKQWTMIGKVGKPHGLRGLFYVSGRCDLLDEDYREVVVGPDPNKGKADLISCYQIIKNRAVIALASYRDRTAVEAILGQSLWAEEVEQGDHEFDHLIDQPLLDCNGVLLGHVRAVYNYGASDVLEIYFDGKGTLDVPYVPSYFVDFDQPESPLKLSVSADHFSDLWASES